MFISSMCYVKESTHFSKRAGLKVSRCCALHCVVPCGLMLHIGISSCAFLPLNVQEKLLCMYHPYAICKVVPNERIRNWQLMLYQDTTSIAHGQKMVNIKHLGIYMGNWCYYKMRTELCGWKGYASYGLGADISLPPWLNGGRQVSDT